MTQQLGWLLALSLVTLECTSSATTKPDPRVVVIDRELATMGERPSGRAAGALFEEKGDRLRAAGQNAAAKNAYREAQRAFNQSPEATNAPALESDRAKAKADAIAD